MATDYISREAAVRAIDVKNIYHGIIEPLQEILCDIPAADVRPVARGHWEDGNKSTKNPERFSFNWWCSICGTPQHTPVAKTLAEFTMENPYCHNCGADMRKREEGEDG